MRACVYMPRTKDNHLSHFKYESDLRLELSIYGKKKGLEQCFIVFYAFEPVLTPGSYLDQPLQVSWQGFADVVCHSPSKRNGFIQCIVPKAELEFTISQFLA